MKILLTNDDGIHAKGLKELRKCMENFGKVIVVAPDRERSGSGHSTSIYQTISCQKMWSSRYSSGYALSGTPVDCVVIGLEKMFGDDKPDLVISGINAGLNLGRDIFYSGTIGAAIEGAFHNVFSIAISIEKNEKSPIYFSAIKMIEKVIKTLPSEAYKQPHFLNINIPNIEYSKIKGVKLTRLAQVYHQKYIKKIYKTDNTEYFWIEGSQPEGIVDKNTDYGAICNNFISITNVSLELESRKNQYNQDIEKWIKKLHT